MLETKNTLSKCSKCVHYKKQIAKLRREFIKAQDESVLESMQHDDEISDLNDECSYAYRLFEDARAEIEQLVRKLA